MISGGKLRDILSAHHGMLQANALNIATKILHSDHTLNKMRVAEALLWQLHANDGQTNGLSVEKLSKVIGDRYERASHALSCVLNSEASLAEKKKAYQSSVVAAVRAKESFAVCNRKVDLRLETSEELNTKRAEVAALEAHIAKLDDWSNTGADKRLAVINAYNANKLYAYLDNRENAGDNRFFKFVDQALAKKYGHAEARQVFNEALAYPAKIKDWKEKCVSQRDALLSEIANIEFSIKARLDGDRQKLLTALHLQEALEAELEALMFESEDALEIVLAILFGRDKEYAEVVELFVNTLSNERAAAFERVSNSNTDLDPAVSAKIDSITAERIALSVEGDGLRRSAQDNLLRAESIKAILGKLDVRQWTSEDVRFDLDQNDRIFAELSRGLTQLDEAWAYVVERYLPGEPETHNTIDLSETLNFTHQADRFQLVTM